ncbi:MAG: efflux RND transporter permease subunit [Gammaproteobacteria bacterium]|nr:MAG: efflux RND transporter permease subunit [Gammaproteobacteria bacterium]
MRRLIEIAIQRRVTIMMFTVAIGLFGMVSLSRLDLNLLPDISYPTLTVRTELTGAAPVEIENLLSKPIEEAVGVIRNVRLVRSVSRAGQSDVTLEFMWGTDMDIAGVEVREKLDILFLPLEASRPLLLRFDPSSEPIMRLGLLYKEEALAGGQTTEAQLKALRRLAEDRIKNDLEAEDGTAAVKVSGGLEDEIQIQVDQQKLSQLGLSIKLIAQRIRAENVNLSGGRIEEGDQRFLVRTLNEFKSVDEFRDAIVAYVAGRPVYLRDVATVVQAYKEREAITRVMGRESVELSIYKEGDANTVQVARRLERRLNGDGGVRDTLPDDMELIIIYDQSRFISSAVDAVKSAAVLGGIIAIIVLFGFLRDARLTAIVGIAIPVSVIGTFLLMYLNGVSLNIMSLGGIALAVGMLVDNSIVVLENIVRKREQGESIVQAAQNGTAEVASAVFASTLTTVAVFFPMVFISGIAGQLFRDQALTVTFALVFSLIVALTLIPMLAALDTGTRYSNSVDQTPPNWFTRAVASVIRLFGFVFAGVRWIFWLLLWVPTWLFQRFNAFVAKFYPGVLAWSLRHRATVIIAATAIFVASMGLATRLGTELIPQLSQGEFSVELRLPPGSTLGATDRAIQAARDATDGIDVIALDFSVAGTGNRLDASPVDAGDNTGTFSLTLIPGAGRAEENATMDSMREELARIPGVQYEFTRPSLMTFASPLQIEISGYDLESLELVSRSIENAMAASDRFADIRTTIENGNPEIQIVFDQERAAKLGLAVRDIADLVVANVRGELATRFTWRDKKIDVLVRSIDTRNSSIDEIRNLIVNPASDRPVTLDAVATISVSQGPAEIRRIALQRVAIISANIGYGDLGTAAAEAGRIVSQTPMPEGISAIVSGQSAEMTESFRSMQFALALAIFLVYIVMASQFESLIHPLVILFTIPLALVGAVLALFLTGTTINIVALIGVIMLAGIVVNNAIVLVDLINQLRAQGMDRIEAIMEAGTARLRPILMTSLTTTLGLLPMAMGFGEGSEVRAPMAITVIGGLLVSTMLTLVVIPVVYSLLDRKRWPGVATAPATQESFG